MPAKKYATVTDLDEFKTEVRGEFAAVRTEIRANSLNGLKPALEAIVKERSDHLDGERAWARVRADIKSWLHVPRLESTSERFFAALIGGIGFTVAGKLGEIFGVWKVIDDAVHHVVHIP